MFARWKADGAWADVVDLLRAGVRAAEGRDPEPSAAVIDSQSVHESAEGVVPAATSGFDGWKKVNGRKRHLMVDTLGLLMVVVVSAANRQDRDGAVALLLAAARRWPVPASARLGRQRLPRRLPGLVQAGTRHRNRGRRAASRAGRVPGPAPPLGRRADQRLDQPPQALRPRLRAPPRAPRRHGPDRRHPPDDPPPRQGHRMITLPKDGVMRQAL